MRCLNREQEGLAETRQTFVIKALEEKRLGCWCITTYLKDCLSKQWWTLMPNPLFVQPDSEQACLLGINYVSHSDGKAVVTQESINSSTEHEKKLLAQKGHVLQAKLSHPCRFH